MASSENFQMNIGEKTTTDSGSVVLDLTYAAILYLSMSLGGNNAILLAAFGIAVFFSRNNKFDKSEYLILFFCFFALNNILFHIFYFDIDRHLNSLAVVFIPLMLFLAKNLTSRAWLYFVYFVIIEIFVGFYEYILGVPTFFPYFASINVDYDLSPDLLYHSRVLGLSSNSSGFAEKIFISLLSVFAIPLSKKSRFLAIIVLFLGIYITFNRTTIIASVILFCMLFITSQWLSRRLKFILTVVVIALIYSLLFSDIGEEISRQFFRGAHEINNIELARRDYAKQAINFIMENPFAGNGSLKYFVYGHNLVLYSHAHNSFLMLFATHGILLSLIYMSYIYTKVSSHNFVFLFPMLVFSFTQYFFFWNLSVADIFLFWVLSGQRSKN